MKRAWTTVLWREPPFYGVNHVSAKKNMSAQGQIWSNVMKYINSNSARCSVTTVNSLMSAMGCIHIKHSHRLWAFSANAGYHVGCCYAGPTAGSRTCGEARCLKHCPCDIGTSSWVSSPTRVTTMGSGIVDFLFVSIQSPHDKLMWHRTALYCVWAPYVCKYQTARSCALNKVGLGSSQASCCYARSMFVDPYDIFGNT